MIMNIFMTYISTPLYIHYIFGRGRDVWKGGNMVRGKYGRGEMFGRGGGGGGKVW